MNNNILMAVGYPLGIMINDGEGSFYIETRDGLYPNVSKKDIGLWQTCLYSKNYDEARESFTQSEEHSDDDFQQTLNLLVDSGLIVEIDGNTMEAYEKLKTKKLFRQGLGLGVSKENENTCYVFVGERIELSRFEHNIWVLANGNITLEELVNGSSEANPIDMVGAVRDLYESGLLIIL